MYVAVHKYYNCANSIVASTATLKDVESFLEECCKMKHFDHPNVLSLIGVSFDKESNPAMVLPFMSNGDVKAYLLSHRVTEHDINTLPPVIIFNCNMHYVQFFND